MKEENSHGVVKVFNIPHRYGKAGWGRFRYPLHCPRCRFENELDLDGGESAGCLDCLLEENIMVYMQPGHPSKGYFPEPPGPIEKGCR